MSGEDLSNWRWLETASEIYNDLTFKKPNDVYNYKAPDPWIAFMLGGVSLDPNLHNDHGCSERAALVASRSGVLQCKTVGLTSNIFSDSCLFPLGI